MMPNKCIVYTEISESLKVKAFPQHPMLLGYERPKPAHLSKSTTIPSYPVLTQHMLSTLS